MEKMTPKNKKIFVVIFVIIFLPLCYVLVPDAFKYRIECERYMKWCKKETKCLLGAEYFFKPMLPEILPYCHNIFMDYDRSMNERLAAVFCLIEGDSALAEKLLLSSLETDNAQEKYIAIYGLRVLFRENPDAVHIEEVLKFISYPDEKVRKSVATYLQRVGGYTYIGTIRKIRLNIQDESNQGWIDYLLSELEFDHETELINNAISNASKEQ